MDSEAADLSNPGEATEAVHQHHDFPRCIRRRVTYAERDSNFRQRRMSTVPTNKFESCLNLSLDDKLGSPLHQSSSTHLGGDEGLQLFQYN